MSKGRPRPLVASSLPELETKVRERVLRLLAAQPRTRAELERSLSRAGAPDAVVGRVLDRFAELKLIDDAAYAQAYVRTGIAVRRRGTRSLSAELHARGVASDSVASAVAEVDATQEYATARALAARRAASMARLEPQVRRRRLMGLLLRRGFSSGLAHAVVSEVLAEAFVDAAGEEDADGDFAGHDLAAEN
jgi:regulatory protein